MLQYLRRPVIAGDQYIGERFVVAQLHVEARPQLLDQIGLEQQRLGLGGGRDDLHRCGGRDHAGDAHHLAGRPRIGGEPLADILGLADIEHVMGRVQHAVDAGRGGRMAHRMLDRGAADRERAFRHRLTAGVDDLRQPGLVILLGAGGSRIDVRRIRVLRRQIGGGTGLRFQRLGPFCGWLLIHGAEFKRQNRSSPAGNPLLRPRLGIPRP